MASRLEADFSAGNSQPQTMGFSGFFAGLATSHKSEAVAGESLDPGLRAPDQAQAMAQSQAQTPSQAENHSDLPFQPSDLKFTARGSLPFPEVIPTSRSVSPSEINNSVLNSPMPRRLAIGQEVKIENPNHRSALTLLLAAKAAQAQAVAQPQAQAQPQVQIQVSTAAKTSLSDIKIVCQNIQEKVGRIHKLQEDAIVAIDQEAINEKLQCGMKELEVLSKETQYALQLAIKTNVGAQTAFAAAIKAESECQKAQKEFAWATEQRNAAPIRNNWQFMCEHNVSQAKQWLKIATKNKKRAVQTARDATADALKIANLTHASAKSIVNLLEMTHPDEISDLQIANILSLQQDVSNRALDLIFNLGEQYKELRSIN